MAQKNDSKIELVKQTIHKVFYFLEEEFYYVPLVKVVESAIFIESIEVEYINELIRRSIDISYTKSKSSGELKYTFTASISRLPYTGVEDFFSLSTYLKSKGKDFPISLVNHFDGTEAELILDRIAAALKENTLEIITGTLWLETFYPKKD